MARLQGSFLLRCWHLSGADRRIAIEHIQTGNQTVVDSLNAAVEWIGSCVRAADTAADRGAGPDTRGPAAAMPRDPP